MVFLNSFEIHSAKATLGLIIANIAVFLIVLLCEIIKFKYDLYMIFGLNFLFFQGFFWQLLTTMFMHGGIFHIAMNMAVLWQFGSILERVFGTKKFLLMYFITGILTSLLCLIFIYIGAKNGNIVNMVGASGAICALLGVLAYFDKRNAKGIFVAILLMSFAPLLVGIKVAWFAHIFGFLVGFGYGFLKRRYGIF
ncbi:MAG: rhomboid family intramembrane serine protease [Campylobacter sp.]|nr:rhomboid family intramembrane serine protease [Campylobacter sp.]